MKTISDQRPSVHDEMRALSSSSLLNRRSSAPQIHDDGRRTVLISVLNSTHIQYSLRRERPVNSA